MVNLSGDSLNFVYCYGNADQVEVDNIQNFHLSLITGIKGVSVIRLQDGYYFLNEKWKFVHKKTYILSIFNVSFRNLEISLL